MKVKISTDSTCDLPKEFIERYDIGVLPMYIVRDGVSLRDGIDITPEDMYEYTKRTAGSAARRPSPSRTTPLPGRTGCAARTP